ncbi:DNA-binding protein [Salmonella enterica]|nr:DNA-binding protein [Salmonella enterica]
MDKQHWKVERQPAWLVAAIKRTIAEMSGGYAEAAEWLGLYRAGKLSTDALYNRLRNEGDQIFPLEWAMVLQDASGTKYVTDAIARRSGGVFVPLVEVDDLDNGDINQRLMESIEWIGKHSQYLRKTTADGVIDPAEREQIEENSYQVMAKWQEHLTLLFRIFCAPEKSDARECAAPGALANNSSSMEK